MKIEIKNLCFRFNALIIFENFNLLLEAEKITCILGKSGKGKTTLLMLLAGIYTPTSGSIERTPLDGRSSISFQDLRLLPWLTAEQNIRYVLPPAIDKKKGKAIAYRYLQNLGLEGFESHFPEQLSGGMQRRVSLARALAFPSETILLDEVFESLDKKTQDDVVALFVDIVKKEKRTVVCVTHNKKLAEKIADTIVEV